MGLSGQKSEEKMFENEKPTEPFNQFLKILGEKTSTLGWDHYSGNLSTSKKILKKNLKKLKKKLKKN
jgi:hypothetical protein